MDHDARRVAHLLREIEGWKLALVETTKDYYQALAELDRLRRQKEEEA
jgi:hypothetical protein